MFTEPVSSWTMSLKRRASYMLLPAVTWWLGNVSMEHVSARKSGHMHPLPAGRGLRTGTTHWGYTSHRMRGGPLSLVKPRRRFKWNEMANCGDTYVFFDPLGSSASMLSSNSQSLAPHNGCQEVVSKGGLDRFIRPTQSSITLTFSTLGPNNKKQASVKRVENAECTSIRNWKYTYEKPNF